LPLGVMSGGSRGSAAKSGSVGFVMADPESMLIRHSWTSHPLDKLEAKHLLRRQRQCPDNQVGDP
jgi:hypothetical protein